MVTFKTSEECRVKLIAATVRFHDEEDEGTTGLDYMASCDRYISPAEWLQVSAARASYGKEDKTGKDVKADKRLSSFLAEHKHATPWEYQHATFFVECPLFVLSQIKTHRTQKSLDLATNVLSRRYTDEKIAFWIPDKWRKQSPNNKQASTDQEVLRPHVSGYTPSSATMIFKSDIACKEKTEKMHMRGEATTYLREHYLNSVYLYEAMLASGVCREQARAVLPESLLTTMYIGGTLRNWAGFIELRSSENVQKETRIVAQRIEKELRSLWPESTSALFNWSDE